jgi:hypothetical protein
MRAAQLLYIQYQPKVFGHTYSFKGFSLFVLFSTLYNSEDIYNSEYIVNTIIVNSEYI